AHEDASPRFSPKSLMRAMNPFVFSFLFRKRKVVQMSAHVRGSPGCERLTRRFISICFQPLLPLVCLLPALRNGQSRCNLTFFLPDKRQNCLSEINHFIKLRPSSQDELRNADRFVIKNGGGNFLSRSYKRNSGG